MGIHGWSVARDMWVGTVGVREVLSLSFSDTLYCVGIVHGVLLYLSHNVFETEKVSWVRVSQAGGRGQTGTVQPDSDTTRGPLSLSLLLSSHAGTGRQPTPCPSRPTLPNLVPR